MAALYVVGAWMVLQVFDLLFPRLGIPDAVMDIAFIGALLGFPVALVFGWIYDITPRGIVRTRPAAKSGENQDLSLRTADYIILASLLLVVAAIVYNLGVEVSELELEGEPELAADVPERSIAVLPFKNMSADPENGFFSDGISEEILNRLSAIGDLHVIARTSSFALKDSGFDVPKTASILGVRYLLQGSVRRDGEQVRISAQLVNRLGKQLWNSSFDRRMERVFELQQEIAETVARNVAPQIAITPDRRRLPRPDAYERYLLGHELYSKRLGGWQWASEQEFRAAIALDPEFAAPYPELAIALMIRPSSEDDPGLYMRQARQAIDSALELDEGLATAYAAKGLWASKQQTPDLAAAEASLRTALELGPNLVNARNWLAGVLRQSGREDEADRELLLAAQMDPLAPIINVNLALSEQQKGQAAQAEQRLLRLLKVPQPSHMIYGSLGELYVETGRLAEAVPMAQQQALAYASGSGQAWAAELAEVYARLGMWESASEWYDYIDREFYTAFRQGHLTRAFMLARQGRHDEALELYEGVLEALELQAADLYRDFRFEYGSVLARQGALRRAVQVLDRLVDVNGTGEGGPEDQEALPALQTLAWALRELGEADRAGSLLAALEAWFDKEELAGRLHQSSALFYRAQNALLAGDEAAAFDRLLRAVGAGWRDHYLVVNDPMWAPLREHRRFDEIVSLVRAEVDAQRAEVEQTDSASDFRERLEAAISDYRARQAVGTADRKGG